MIQIEYDVMTQRNTIIFVCLLYLAVLATVAAPVRAQCPPGDVNGDCRVDGHDIALMASQWLIDPNALVDPNLVCDPNDLVDPNNLIDPNEVADLNEDGSINLIDLAIVAEHWGQVACPIAINELLAHSHSVAPDWIELYNDSSLPIDLGGWTFSDEQQNLAKYRIADGTTIEPHGYIVFYEDLNFGNPGDPGTLDPFRMSENGETLYLTSPNDVWFGPCLIEQTFGASETGISFGRYGTSTGRQKFVPMSEPTPGTANAYPLVGPIVINEIMYHPGGDGDAEYVELLNVSDAPVTLFDHNAMLPWRFRDENGIEFSFPSDNPVTLMGHEYLLLARDLSLTRQSYSVPANVQALEWDSGKLSNSGETLRLLKPGDVDEGGIRYWIEVDRVRYSDGSHGENFDDGLDLWPTEADGLGPSLNRMFWNRYGDDPNNWQATIHTPGSTND